MAKSYATTYCDGSRPGCTWSGAAHASTSSRTAQRREGGRVRDLWDDYAIAVTAFQGAGMPEVAANVLDQALLPGNLFQSSKVRARTFSLICEFSPTSLSAYHSNRRALLNAIKSDLVSPEQPVRLRYSGGMRTVEIAAYYLGGLEGDVIGGQLERAPVRFLACDPFWYELGEQAAALNTGQTINNANGILQRLSGTWGALGTGVDNGGMRAVAIGPDGMLYAGGSFTQMGGVANTSRVAKWDGSTWTALGAGAADNTVLALTVGADGTVYAGGSFTQMGGVANTSRIAKWNGSAWSALGTGAADGTVYALLFGQDGILYATGGFTQMGGVANTLDIAKWNGSAWSAMTTGLSAVGYCLARAADGGIYVGGDFATAGGVTVNSIAKWSGSAWSALGAGVTKAIPPGSVRGIATTLDGTLYVGGDITTAGAVTVADIARWNGTAWEALGAGLGGVPYGLAVGLDGLLWAVGAFTSAGGLTLADRLATWNGTQWAQVDVDLPGTPNTYAVAVEQENLNLPPGQIGPLRVVVGYDTTGSATGAQLTTVTNTGSRTTYPKIVIKRAGGTLAQATWLRNETTEQVLYLSYDLLDGETITIDLTPGQKRIRSDYFGDVLGRTALPFSDFASFGLAPGSNDLTLYLITTGAPVITCYAVSSIPHWSPDGPS